MQKNSKFDKEPHNSDAEARVVAAILQEGSRALKKVEHVLKASDFYEEDYRIVYKAAESLSAQGTEPDIITIADRIKRQGDGDKVGGSGGLSEMGNAAMTSTRLPHYAKIVRDHSSLRKILKANREIALMTQDPTKSMGDLLVEAEEKLRGVTREAADAEDRLEMVDLQKYMDYVKENPTPAGQIRGISTGLNKIDKMTKGFVPGEVMIISGQTSHGKTQLTNNIMMHAANNGHKVAFITLEMTKEETAERFNSLTDNEDIGEGKILLNNRPDLSPSEVTKLIERNVEEGCDMVVIDHLHSFPIEGDNRSAAVSRNMALIKSAALRYRVPIILICHVKKMAPKKHPTLEDLRDSSFIAQDADMVLIVWRNEDPSAPNPNEVEVVNWKNRNRGKEDRREYLYADGLMLNEDDTSDRARQAEDTARRLGEKDRTITLGGFGEEDLDLPDFKSS